MKGIIFDVDGTLWDSTREVAVAWNKVLQDEMEGREILTAEGLQKEFGKPMDAIAESLFPEMSEKDRMELLGKMMEEQIQTAKELVKLVEEYVQKRWAQEE